jgi:hypothetical protein
VQPDLFDEGELGLEPVGVLFLVPEQVQVAPFPAARLTTSLAAVVILIAASVARASDAGQDAPPAARLDTAAVGAFFALLVGVVLWGLEARRVRMGRPSPPRVRVSPGDTSDGEPARRD